MTARTRKHILLLAIAVATLVAVTPGCEKKPHYTWTKAGPASTEYVWRVVNTHAQLEAICGQEGAALLACASQGNVEQPCVVFSTLREDEARRATDPDGLTIFEHEVWNADKSRGHCAGWRHQ